MKTRFSHVLYFVSLSVSILPVFLQAEDLSFHNSHLLVSIRQDGSYAISSGPDERLIFRSAIAAQINHRWLKSSEYPKHELSESRFRDRLGLGQQVNIRSTGLTQPPDVSCISRL